MPEIPDLIAELSDVYAELGLPRPGPGVGPEVLDEIDRVIAPLRLPADVRALWESVDVGDVDAASMYPALSTPDFGLHTWQAVHSHEGFDPINPRHLFQLCYSSHDTLWVECDGPGWEGGRLFESFISDPAFPFTFLFRGVTDWLEVLIAALREGAFERVEPDFVRVDDDRAREIAAAKLAAHGPDPLYGGQREIPTDYTEWPAGWQRLSGIAGELDAPPPDVTTIAELIRSARVGAARGRVLGRVVRSFGAQAVIYDGTGQLQIAVGPSGEERTTGKEYLWELEMPARGEPTPPFRDAWFHLNPLRRGNFDLFKVAADAVVAEQRRIPGEPLARTQTPAVTSGVAFHRLSPFDRYGMRDPRRDESVWPEVGQVSDLLAAIPGLLVRCVPPRAPLNDLLRRGRVEPGERAGCTWTPLQLSPDAYLDVAEELLFEGTRVAPFRWGAYETITPPEGTTTWEAYREWRDRLPGPLWLTVEEIAAALAETAGATARGGDDPEERAARTLARWDAQRAAVLYLRRRWRGHVAWRGMLNLEALAGTMLESAVDAFTAQRALWFAVRAGDGERIARARGLLSDAVAALDAFLAEYGPGGAKPPGFEQGVHWQPPFALYGLPATERPASGEGYSARWEQELAPNASRPRYGMLSPDPASMTLHNGEGGPDGFAAVTTRRASAAAATPSPEDRAIEALVAAALSGTSYGAFPGAPENRALAEQARGEITSAREAWTLDGEPHPATRFAVRGAYAVLIELPGSTVIVSGTARLGGRELITLTDLSPWGL